MFVSRCVKGILHFVCVYVDLSLTLRACSVIAVTALHLYPSLTRPLMTHTNPQIITYPEVVPVCFSKACFDTFPIMKMSF